VKRLYIPLPEAVGRRAIVVNLLKKHRNNLSDADVDAVVQATEGARDSCTDRTVGDGSRGAAAPGYSGSDMAHLCREAAMGPIRTLGDITHVTADDVRPVSLADFEYARTQVRASVSAKDLDAYVEWNRQFGSLG
jgi:fidgetin-like protein 1